MEPNLCISFSSKIYSVHFSHFDWSDNVLCIATSNRIIVGLVRCDKKIDFEIVEKFKTKCYSYIVVLSPETSLNSRPGTICVCSAEADCKLHIYKRSPELILTENILCGHKRLINAISYDYNANYLASTSDDKTVRIWATDTYMCEIVFKLTSPGISLCWNKIEKLRLMVAEKIGIIRFYNISLKQSIFCLTNFNTCQPLNNAHWASNNACLVTSVLQNGYLLLWDITRSCNQTIKTQILKAEFGNGNVQFNSNNEFLAITNNSHNVLQVLITNSLKTILVHSSNANTISDISWHCRIPILCAVNDDKLLFFRIQYKL